LKTNQAPSIPDLRSVLPGRGFNIESLRFLGLPKARVVPGWTMVVEGDQSTLQQMTSNSQTVGQNVLKNVITSPRSLRWSSGTDVGEGLGTAGATLPKSSN